MSPVGVRKELSDVGYCSECGKKGKITIRDSKKYCAEHAPPSTWVPPVIDPRSDPRNRRFKAGEREDEGQEPEARGI